MFFRRIILFFGKNRGENNFFSKKLPPPLDYQLIALYTMYFKHESEELMKHWNVHVVQYCPACSHDVHDTVMIDWGPGKVEVISSQKGLPHSALHQSICKFQYRFREAYAKKYNTSELMFSLPIHDQASLHLQPSLVLLFSEHCATNT